MVMCYTLIGAWITAKCYMAGWWIHLFQNSSDGIVKTDGFGTSLVGLVVKTSGFQGRG